MIRLISGWATTDCVWDRFCEKIDLPVDRVLWTQELSINEEDVCIGWSIGGMLLLERLIQRPCKAAILVATTPRIVEDENYRGASKSVLESMKTGLSLNRNAVLRQFFKQSLFPVCDDVVVEKLLEESKRFSEAELSWGLDYLMNTDLRLLASSIQTPCHIIHSLDDTIISYEAAKYLAKNIPYAKLHEVKGSGHAVCLTHYEDIIRVVESI